mgnify:CR=1 FL=1|tara:strand:+ start:339 stop:824 length:486 start_codon:yes stop_codon:yes gene_type:complete
MKYHVTYQNTNDYQNAPNIFHVQRWVNTTLENLIKKGELTLRLVNSSTIQSLNNQYRRMDKPTNVLSFPCELPEEVRQQLDYPALGDIIICHEVIEKEALDQNKTLQAHYAHMVVHGVLHLLGYDHIKKNDAQIMEPIEIETLAKLGISNPYEASDDINND